MKKYIAVLMFAAASLTAASSSWAFQSIRVTTVTATVTTGGARVADFSLAIRSVSNPFGGNLGAITWSGVDPLSTQWKVADSLLVINSTVTDNNGGIKIYTDNTSATAVPRYVDPTPLDANDPDSLAGGLLKGTAGTTSAAPLPMAWSVKAASNTVPVAANPNHNGVNGNPTDTNAFQWLFMTDKSNWDGIDNNNDNDFTDANETAPLALDAAFPKVISSVGIHFGQADSEFGATPDGSNAFVYFQANFTGADVQQAYQTSALRVEAFIQ